MPDKTTTKTASRSNGGLFFPDQALPSRYRLLRRNMVILMFLVAMSPLVVMTIINHHQYQQAMEQESVQPIRAMLTKTKNSFELFLTERLSAVSFIASAYSFQDLADQDTLNRIFRVMKQEFGGFVDIGVVDAKGIQISYNGPYELKGKDYSQQPWLQEVLVRGTYISEVFLGYRKFPHFIISVRQGCEDKSGCYIVRAAIDDVRFNSIIAAMGLDAQSDAFIISHQGVFQTASKFYGRVLEKFPMPVPPVSYVPTVLETTDNKGRRVILCYSYFLSPDFILMVVKPRTEVLKSWYALRGDILLFLVVSLAVIFLVIYWVTGQMVKRIEESDLKRQTIDHELQYTNKLASIGRLAAGVAHEINNPMAIINEKTGLMKDLILREQNFPQKDKLLALSESILKSVERCSTITHRLLGFARRMDVAIEVMDLNEVIREVLGFLEKEALHRNIDLRLELDSDMPKIASDRGQLQQVFLNILNNAFEAVVDGGIVAITSWNRDLDTVSVQIRDNGQGMSEETLQNIFEPFYTTKKGYGTGLGLSITYGIVKKLGGRIEVQSKEGQGTSFTVILPKKARQAVETHHEQL